MGRVEVGRSPQHGGKGGRQLLSQSQLKSTLYGGQDPLVTCELATMEGLTPHSLARKLKSLFPSLGRRLFIQSHTEVDGQTEM